MMQSQAVKLIGPQKQDKAQIVRNSIHLSHL